jgi:MFS family permease
MPLKGVIALLTVVAIAIGTVYPVCTVSIQNAVPRHQVGVAMGAMNFFRSLGSALVVAVMGAIILAWLGAVPERGAGSLGAFAASQGIDLADVFRWVFVAAAACLASSFAAIAAMEERPLRATTSTATTTISADPGSATPAG